MAYVCGSLSCCKLNSSRYAAFSQLLHTPLSGITLTLVAYRQTFSALSAIDITLVLGFLVYPHIAMWFYVKRGCSSALEKLYLHIDMFLIGGFIYQVDMFPIVNQRLKLDTCQRVKLNN